MILALFREHIETPIIIFRKKNRISEIFLLDSRKFLLAIKNYCNYDYILLVRLLYEYLRTYRKPNYRHF
jgi:hypothetical protein